MENHKAFIEYLNFLQEQFGLFFTIKRRADWSNFMTRELSMMLIPYMLHTNTYCSTIKSEKTLLMKCSCMGDHIENKCMKTKTFFYGQCHAGVEEFIIPIFTVHNEFMGYITAGTFQGKNRKAFSRVEKIRRMSFFENIDVLGNYNKLTDKTPLEINMLEKALGIVAKYLADLYERAVPQTKTASFTKPLSSEDGILGKVIEIITNNIEQSLLVHEIADQCNCSESYLNHLFKKNTGINIRAYINWLRIKKAQDLLHDQNLSISDISSVVGFNDPNYFSKVFINFTGKTPRDYRKTLL